VVHDPFPVTFDWLAVILPGGDGVDAPVDEHAETSLLKPFQALRFLFGGLSGESLDWRKGSRGSIRAR
jgi:hypothetical protein